MIFILYFSDKMSKENEISRKIKWGTITPLIGGSAIGCSMSLGTLPEYHLSYQQFTKNEVHLEKYWPDVKKFYIDLNQEPENMSGKFKSVQDCAKCFSAHISKF